MEERPYTIIICQLVTHDFEADLGTQSQPLAPWLYWATRESKVASKDPHTYWLGCSPPVPHSCPHLSRERAHQVSLVGIPTLGQHGKTHSLGKSIVCCKLHHAALPQERSIMGKEDKELFCVCSAAESTTFIWLGTQSHKDFFQSGTLRIASLAARFVTSHWLPDVISSVYK